MDDSTVWVLDRIEDDSIAVLVSGSGEVRQVEVDELPSGSREGHAFREAAGEASARYAHDPEATARLKEEAEKLRASLRRGPSGPISL